MYGKKAEKGRFKPKNPEKYKGNVDNIEYRSSWEKRFMRYADKNPGIVKWSSEETVIPYICKTDGKKHRYFMDFWIKTDKGQEYLIEVKPEQFTRPPKEPKRKTKSYFETVRQYVKNQSKWEYAEAYAEKRNMKFIILTERHLQRGI